MAELRYETENTAAKRPRRRGLIRLFVKNRDGATMIEFGMLAMPFCMMLFAILESCISFASQEYMQNITNDIARQLRTGQLRSTTGLKATVCKDLKVFVTANCETLIEVDLRSFTSYANAAALTIPFKDNDLDTSGFKSELGGENTIQTLRVFYRWPVFTDLLRLSMSNIKDGKTLHYATVTWRNEPFGT